MDSTTRRDFLAGSLAGLAATQVFGVDKIASPTTRPASPSTQPIEVKTPEEYTFNPDTLFLTWQRDPTTTMTVQWVGTRGETDNTNVYHSASLLGPWVSRPSTPKPLHPATDLKVFRCELTGLKPDTLYYFRIGKDSPFYRFRTMPEKATDTISFISGGDCGVNPHALANNVQAARQDPAFALIGGDLAYENGKSVNTFLGFLRNYSKSMIGRDGRLIPMLACIGNHEVDGGYDKPRSKAPFFYSIFDGLFPDTGYATLDFGDYLSLVLLDTGHTSKIGGEQASWLEKTLKARVDHPNLMVANHVPAYPSNRKMEGTPPKDGGKPKDGTGAENRRHWVPLFDKYRVPVVLEHHDHTFKRSKRLVDGLENNNGVLYLGDGSWGKIRAPQPPEKLHHLALTSRAYHLSLHRIQGEERFHLALDEFGRVMDVSRTAQRTKGLVAVPG